MRGHGLSWSRCGHDATGLSAVLAASGGGEERCQSLLGVVIGAVRDCGRGPVVFEGVDKLGELLGRECGAAVC